MGPRRGRWRWAAVVVLAVLLGACSDDDGGDPVVAADDDAVDEAVVDESVAPLLGDHWHLALGVNICGDEQPPLVDAKPDESGIHSHGDGLIHVHPFTTEVTGSGALLDAFFDTVGAEVTDDGLVAADWTLPFEGECDGEAAHLVVTKWSDVTGEPVASPVTSAEALRSIALRPDGGAIVLALATDDAPAALPSSASQLSAPEDVTGRSPDAIDASGLGTPATDVDFGFAPVLGTTPAPCSSTATPTEAGDACYELGPVHLGPEAVERAEATLPDQVSWIVELTLTADGIDAFNSLARACFDGEATCPTSQLAIVAGGVVMSAPTVSSPSFEADQISISGAFTEEEARALAASLDPADD